MQLPFSLSIPNGRLDAFAKGALICAIFFTPLGNAPAYAFMVFTVLAWGLAGGYLQRLRVLVQAGPLTWSTLALYGMLLLGVLYSEAPWSDVQTELTKYAKLVFMLLAITLLQEEKWQERALNAFAIAMVITLALSMVSVVHPLQLFKLGQGTHAVFRDYIAQNLMMAFFVLLMLVRSLSHRSKAMRAVFLALAALGIVNILGYVPGRTGYIALAAVVATFIAIQVPARWRWSCLLLAVAVGIAIFQLSGTFRARVEQAITEFRNNEQHQITSVGARLDMARKSAALIEERPLLGWGTGAYPTQYCRLTPSEEGCKVGGYHPHNQFLAFGVQLGALGILGYLAFLGSAAWRASLYSGPRKTLAFGLLAALLVDSVLHAPLFLVTEAQFFTLMLAVVLAHRPPTGLPSPVLEARALQH